MTSKRRNSNSPAGSVDVRICDTFASFAIIVTFLMMLHVVVSFISRSFLSYAVPATLEAVANYYMVVLVFAGLVHVARGELISMTVLISRTGKAHQFATVSHGLTAIYAGLLAFASFDVAVQTTRDGEMVDTGFVYVLVWPSRWVVFGCLAVVSLLTLWRTIQGARTLAASRVER